MFEIPKVISDRAADSIPGWARGAATNVTATSVCAQKCDRDAKVGGGGAFVDKRHG